MIASIAPLLAGLGLFFSGIHFVSANLTPLAGRKFRLLLARATRHHWLGALAGVLAGVITQSTNAVAYVTISMVSVGAITKQRAMPIPVWSHVGASLLVILVAVDFRVAASYIVALAGFAVFFGIGRGDQVKHLIGTFLGVGLLFLGIEMLKSGIEPLRDFILQQGVLAAGAHHPAILLLLGVGLTVAFQFSTVTGAVAVTAATVGLIDFSGACLMIYGANLGAGITYVLLARGLKGDGRQIALMQTAQKLFGFAAVVLLLAVEWITGWSILQAAVGMIARSVPEQVALVFLLYQVVGSTICSLLMAKLIPIFDRLLPPSRAEALAKPAFLTDDAMFEPSLALDLVVREERRLLERLPLMLDRVRVDGDLRVPGTESLRMVSVTVLRAISRYLEAVAETGPDRADVERLVRLQHRTANLGLLFDALDDFVVAAEKSRQWPASGRVADQMIEAMHALIGALVDASASEDETDQQLVLTMLGHRDELMERMRRRVLLENPDLPAEAQEALFATTMLFERIVWLARRSAMLVVSDAAPAAAAAVTIEPDADPERATL